MLELRPGSERGHFDHGWLDTRHTFSFADYYDPKHMGFRSLRVINEDRVAPGKGFGTHGHRSMEIMTYVLSGALEHKDSMGNGSVIRPGEVQVMGAGTGVMHSEYNASKSELVHFYQIWILPRAQGGAPRYAQRAFSRESRAGKLCCFVSPDGRDESLTIQSDASVYGALLDEGQSLVHGLLPGRNAWVQVARGSIDVNGKHLDAGDGIALSDEAGIALTGIEAGELLLFDLP